MRTMWANLIFVLMLLVASVLWFILAVAAAQGKDLNEIHKQYEDHRKAGRYVEAERLAKQAIELCEKQFGRGRIHCAWTLNNLAAVYQDQGRYGEAIPLHQRALAIEEKALGAEHPDVVRSLSNLAVAYRYQGRHAEMIPLYERKLAITEKMLGREHPDVGWTLVGLATAYENQGRYAEALQLLERGLPIAEKVLEAKHPSAILYLLISLHDKLAFLREIVRKNAFGREYPDVSLDLDGVNVYLAQGRYAEAIQSYERLMELLQMLPERERVGRDAAQLLSNLAFLYGKVGDYRNALSLSRRAAAIVPTGMDREQSLVVAKAVDENVNRVGAFPTLMVAAFHVAERPALADEALAAAQRAGQTSGGLRWHRWQRASAPTICRLRAWSASSRT